MFVELVVTAINGDVVALGEKIRKLLASEIGITAAYIEVATDDSEEDKEMKARGYRKVKRIVVGADKSVWPDVICWRKMDIQYVKQAETIKETTEKVPKVFRINDHEWWAGYGLGSTVNAFLDEGEKRYIAIDDPRELNEEEMNRLKYVDDNENGTEKTFKEALTEMINNKRRFPCFFASTEY